MSEESLKELEAAFENWRQNKRNSREPMPDVLWQRTLEAVETHGASAVSVATKIQRSRILDKCALRGKRSAESAGLTGVATSKETAAPGYSRVSILAPSVSSHPIAEVQTAQGLKLRLFVQTPEMLNLLSSLCSSGGAR